MIVINVTELGCLAILQEPCQPHLKMDHNTFFHYKSGSIPQQRLNMYFELRNVTYQIVQYNIVCSIKFYYGSL